ncbi:MAG TPA: hypothetical protein VFQ05_03565 [Candidatus Eisenbacteria bacterium]|nr:hypothetical protein [Candidatus Eisenbacteria bacterium]
MKVLRWLGVAAAALLMVSCAPNVYNSESPDYSRGYDARDFNGRWELDTGRGDYGGAWMDEQDRFGADWESADRTDRMRYRAWFLPDVFRISGSGQVVRIQDEGGSLIAEISLEDAGYRYGAYEDGPYTNARWINDNRFEVQRVGRNGGRITQLFTLENRDRRLVVSTRVEREGTTRNFTRVYERA